MIDVDVSMIEGLYIYLGINSSNLYQEILFKFGDFRAQTHLVHLDSIRSIGLLC